MDAALPELDDPVSTAEALLAFGQMLLSEAGRPDLGRRLWVDTDRVLAPLNLSAEDLATVRKASALARMSLKLPPPRYDLNLWIDHPLEGATYLPR